MQSHAHSAPRHISHLVLGLPLGGTEGLVDLMLRNPPDGFRASAICLDQLGLIGERALMDGLDVRLLSRGEGINWALARTIAHHCRLGSVEILHCHQYTPWFYGVLSRLYFPGLRVIFTEHGRHYPDLPSARRRAFNLAMAPLTSAFTAVSPAASEALQRVDWFPGRRIEVIYNGVDGRRFEGLPDRQELRRALGLRQDSVYFVLCSRLDPVKWIGGLLEALQRVVSELPSAGLVLVGDGSEMTRIQEQVYALRLSDHVVMTGYQSNTPEWLTAADVFVLSSLSEGTSVSLIESMAAGLPAVATRVGGNEYVIIDGVTGMLVPERDAGRLASAMLHMARDLDLRSSYGAAAKKRFHEHFALDRMYDGYAGLYRRLVA